MTKSNKEYRFADIKSCCQNDIAALEKSIGTENGKDIVLIAYEKKN